MSSVSVASSLMSSVSVASSLMSSVSVVFSLLSSIFSGSIWDNLSSSNTLPSVFEDSSFSSVVAGSSMTIVSLSFPTSTSFPSFSASSASFLKVADSAEGSAFISVVVLPTTVSSPEDISSFEDSPPP